MKLIPDKKIDGRQEAVENNPVPQDIYDYDDYDLNEAKYPVRDQPIEESKENSRYLDDDDQIAYLEAHLKKREEWILKLRDGARGPIEESKSYSKSPSDLGTIVNNLIVNFEDFSKLYNYHIPDSNLKMTKDSTIDLDLSQEEEDLALLKALFPSVMPDCKDLALRSIKDSKETVWSFLKKGFPQNVANFSLNEDPEQVIDIGEYIEAILGVSQQVTNSVTFMNFEMNEIQLGKLFKAYKHLEEFGLSFVKINQEHPPDFSEELKGTKINALRFSDLGDPDACDWRYQPSHCRALIKALGKSDDLKNSLKEITLTKSGMRKQLIRDILDENGFSEAEIVGETQ